MNENKKKIAGTMALMAVLVSGVVGGGIFLTKNIGKSAREISKEEAMEDLPKLLKKINVTEVAARKAQVQIGTSSLIDELVEKVHQLNRDNFSVKQHLKFVDLYADKKSYEALTPLDIAQLQDEIGPLVLPCEDEINAVRFDALMYAIELGYIANNPYQKGIKDLKGKARAVASVSTIPAVKAKSEILDRILNTDYVERADINDLETIRKEIRDIIKFIPVIEWQPYTTDFTDDIVNMVQNPYEPTGGELQNYRAKVNYYIRQHMDNAVIAKLHTNKPLTTADIEELEKILWSELGTEEEYRQEYKDKPLGELVREIVGLDINSAKEAFAKYLNDVNLDDRQIYFVNQIINYIVQNGMMKNFAVMQEAPFTDKGDVGDIFTDTVVWIDIMKIIKSINANALAA